MPGDTQGAGWVGVRMQTGQLKEAFLLRLRLPRYCSRQSCQVTGSLQRGHKRDAFGSGALLLTG